MKISPLFALALCVALPRLVAAQDAPQMPEGDVQNAPVGANSRATSVLQIDEGALADLPALLRKVGPAGAVSLRVSEEAFAANTRATRALLDYVRGGGTVFLHTGAARAFGFQTVPARLGTNALAGQLYGRGRAALPFGAHPLLWDDTQAAPRRAPGTDPTLFPGVNVVFYEMQEGDHLVLSHPAGTPLLQATDLASDAGGVLYAAALAPFGRGFAIFTPDFIDPRRGDGALFTRNLLGLVSRANLAAIPASVIQNGGNSPEALQKALAIAGASGGTSPALPAFGTAPENTPGEMTMTPAMDAPNAPDRVARGETNTVGAMDAEMPAGAPEGAAMEGAAPEATQTDAIFLISRSEASAMATLLSAGGERAGAAINVLRARLFLMRGDVRGATRSLEAGAALLPDAGEVALMRGILQVGAAQNLDQPSPVRAELVQNGAKEISFATGTPSLFAAPLRRVMPGITPGGANAGGANRNAPAPLLAGLPLATLRSWSTRLGQIAQVFALEPPRVERYGSGAAAITVRAFANDSSALLIVPGAQALAGTRNFGWHGDREEILIFPTPQMLSQYRRALGLNAPTVPLPAGAVGDVVGQRIAMVAFAPNLTSTQDPVTGLTSVSNNRNSAVNVLARLHSYVLLGAYDEGARSPQWLQMGLENLANIAIAGDNDILINTQTLDQSVRVGRLLTPAQFAEILVNSPQTRLPLNTLPGNLPGNGMNTVFYDQMRIAQAQSAALMAYFYRTFGAGAVTETVQRLGSGQSIDEVLEATTETDQLGLFRSWRDARFGPRRPNN